VAYAEEDMAGNKRESQMSQKWQTIVNDVGVLCFSYLEEYPTQ